MVIYFSEKASEMPAMHVKKKEEANIDAYDPIAISKSAAVM
jgi:hypothetical protein